MSSAAQRDEMADELVYQATGTDGAWASDGGSALQQLAAERLAAHRQRRAQEKAREEELREVVKHRSERARNDSQRGASKVREAVAARYQQSVSYREFLAAEAERAIQQAQAEADVAARNAKAVAEAQMQLMEELERWNQPEPGPREIALAQEQAETRGELAHELADIALAARELMTEPPMLSIVEAGPRAALKVRMFEELGPASVKGFRDNGVVVDASDPHGEMAALEQEIAFRLAPEFTDHTIETMPIAANLIEFPRQLVAPRKARPRLAEGPLRDEVDAAPQLRIFEVEAEQISLEPAVHEPAAAPEWQSLQLGAATQGQLAVRFDAQMHLSIEPETAPMELRLMAAAVDACCVLGAFLGFVTVAALTAGHAMHVVALPLMAGTGAGVLAAIFLGFKLLFFTLGEATPGMQFARIGLCTFADGNPTRKAMRRRIFASLLAACPLGLGLAWMAMDNDRLGWHDRMSRMYPRAY